MDAHPCFMAARDMILLTIMAEYGHPVVELVVNEMDGVVGGLPAGIGGEETKQKSLCRL